MRKMFSKNQIKEIVNEGIQSGEIQTPKDPTLDDIQYEFNQEENFCIVTFPKGVMPEYIQLVADDDQESYIYIGIDSNRVEDWYLVSIYNDGNDFKLVFYELNTSNDAITLRMDYDDAFHTFVVNSMTYKKYLIYN